MLINTTAALERFCAELEGAPYIAVDTEFVQHNSYYARLCLVQVAYGDHAAAIDPLSRRIELTALRKLLYSSSTKVFHAATKDLAILLNRWGAVPTPVFDTQIAASLCGYGEQVGYGRLVEGLLGFSLDKSAQTTDWAHRPLSQEQLVYALGDVTHLCTIYEMLREKLTQSGRDSWGRDEMARLDNTDRYEVSPADAWLRVKARHLEGRALAVLRELARWREQTAQDRDQPRQWVMKDRVLISMAKAPPRGRRELAQIQGLKTSVAHGEDGREMLQAIHRALQMPPEQWPTVPVSAAHSQSAEYEPLVSMLHALLLQRCLRHEVAPGIVARRADLFRIVIEPTADIPVLQGWRREIFGEDALRLCRGEAGLIFQDGQVVLQ